MLILLLFIVLVYYCIVIIVIGLQLLYCNYCYYWHLSLWAAFAFFIRPRHPSISLCSARAACFFDIGDLARHLLVKPRRLHTKYTEEGGRKGAASVQARPKGVHVHTNARTPSWGRKGPPLCRRGRSWPERAALHRRIRALLQSSLRICSRNIPPER